VYLTESDKSEKSMIYPSLRDALALRWSRLETKKLKVSQTYAKFRIFEEFRLDYTVFTIKILHSNCILIGSGQLTVTCRTLTKTESD
jgi:hypothetical protein